MRASVESPRSRSTRTSSAARPLMVPAKTSSPGRLLDREGLAGHGRLIHVALAGRHAPVQRDLFAGPNDDDVAHPHIVDRAAPVRCLRGGRGRPRARDPSALESRRARAPSRAPRAAAPARTGTRRSPLAPLAEHHRAADGDEHQDVDVERERSSAWIARRTLHTPPLPIAARYAATATRRSTPPKSRIMPIAIATPERTTSSRPRRRRAAAGAARRARATRACRSARRPRRWRMCSSFAASYLIRSRCPSTSASSASSPDNRSGAVAEWPLPRGSPSLRP